MLVTQNRPPIVVLVSGDKVEPAIYAATIEKLRRTAVPVHLDREHGAFHDTNPELGWQHSATRARRRQPSRDGHGDNDQDAGGGDPLASYESL